MIEVHVPSPPRVRWAVDVGAIIEYQVRWLSGLADARHEHDEPHRAPQRLRSAQEESKAGRLRPRGRETSSTRNGFLVGWQMFPPRRPELSSRPRP